MYTKWTFDRTEVFVKTFYIAYVFQKYVKPIPKLPVLYILYMLLYQVKKLYCIEVYVYGNKLFKKKQPSFSVF